MSSAPGWERSTSPARTICCDLCSQAWALFSCCITSAPAVRPSSSPIATSRSRRSFYARCSLTFALDDCYRDNRDYALPVMREFDAPFAVYVASDFAEGSGPLWWVALEGIIAKASSVEVAIGGTASRLDTSTPAAKQAAFDRL